MEIRLALLSRLTAANGSRFLYAAIRLPDWEVIILEKHTTHHKIPATSSVAMSLKKGSVLLCHLH